jgi:hypothetical protein
VLLLPIVGPTDAAGVPFLDETLTPDGDSPDDRVLIAT